MQRSRERLRLLNSTLAARVVDYLLPISISQGYFAREEENSSAIADRQVLRHGAFLYAKFSKTFSIAYILHAYRRPVSKSIFILQCIAAAVYNDNSTRRAIIPPSSNMAAVHLASITSAATLHK